ncbi:MAG: hypothetical protein IAG13_15385 [Deltaproteobacteria bacterium]|nr:hypothetical protein [Nannocystaceae bacterium]
MRARVIPWSLFGVIACFSEADVPLGGTETQGSASSGDESSASSPSTTVSASSEPTTAESLTAPTSADASSDDPTGVDATGEDCPAGTRAIPLPLPIGWEGIEALALAVDGGKEPTCPDGLVADTLVYAEPIGVDCACTCSPLCWITGFMEEGCTDASPPDAIGAAAESCGEFATTTDIPFHVGVTENDGLADTGSCEVPEATASIDASRHRVCGHSSGTECMPAPDDAALAGPCVSRDGDIPCPMPSEYTERYVVVADATGLCLECEPCVAAAISGCAAGEVTLYDDFGCVGEAETFAASVCSAEVGVSATMDFDPGCPGHDGVAETSGTRTYCCVP